MSLQEAEHISKIRKEKAREAIAMAMENRWEEAVAINKAILELFSTDIEAQNRLGKAHFELGEYGEARAAFAQALLISPSNAIAIKNLDRLNHLATTGNSGSPKKARKLAPQQFLGESGKTGITALERLAGNETLARIAAGDAVTLRIVENTLVVESSEGDYIGKLPIRLGMRLVKLIIGGNKYEAAITRLSARDVNVIIREEYQHPDQRTITSFPTHKEPLLAYARAALQDMDSPEEDEESEPVTAPEWEDDGDNDDAAAPRPTFVASGQDEDENDE